MLILGGMFFAIVVVLFIYYKIRRRRSYATWKDGVVQRMRERGYDVKELDDEILALSRQKES